MDVVDNIKEIPYICKQMGMVSALKLRMIVPLTLTFLARGAMNHSGTEPRPCLFKRN